MLITKMAFRNIFRQKRRSLLTGLSMFGGFVLATIFIGFADGSYNHIIDQFTRNNLGHIQIHQKDYLDRPSLYKTIDNYQEVVKKISEVKNIESWAPRVFSAGLASVKEKSAGVRIIGILPALEDQTVSYTKKIIKGRPLPEEAKHEVLLGKGLAKILKATVDDSVVIVGQGADGSIANDRYTVVGILESGDELADRVGFYLHIQDAQELLVLGKRIHEITITVSGLKRVLKIDKQLDAVINDPTLAVDPWQEFAKSFYVAMKADKQGMWITLVIIVLIVAVGVLNTVLMVVLERRREYGVLRAMGTRPWQIVKLVVAEVNFLAVFSILLGVVAGFFINLYLSHHGITLTEPFSYGGMKFTHMMSEINWRMFVIPAITVFVSAVLVGFFPALKAGRTEPAKTMRMH